MELIQRTLQHNDEKEKRKTRIGERTTVESEKRKRTEELIYFKYKC